MNIQPTPEMQAIMRENDLLDQLATLRSALADREGDSGLYEAEQGSLGDRQRIPKMRRRTASAEKIVAYILKWVDSVPR